MTLFERSTGASRTTTLMGRAVLEACREAIAQCKAMAAELLGVPAERIDGRARRHSPRRKTRLTWPEIIEKYFQMEGCSIVGRAYLRRAGDAEVRAGILGNRRGGRGDRARRRDRQNFARFAGHRRRRGAGD